MEIIPVGVSHFQQRAMVFEDLRVLYTPVPKASCTALLWALAEAVGLDVERFASSRGREVTPSLTIHDLNRWPREYRFGARDPETLEEVLAGDGWLRLTVVRDPFRRLWSAWQSKLLLTEPQFSEKFGLQPWFPPSIDSAEDIAASFREFLTGLADDPDLVRADVHWAPQVELIGHPYVAYSHIGRVEQLDDTIAVLGEHVEQVTGQKLPELGKPNRTPVPFVGELLDEAGVALLSQLYAEDLQAFGYSRPETAGSGEPLPESWLNAAEIVRPALVELRERNARVGDLQRNGRGAEELLRHKIEAEKLRYAELLEDEQALQAELSQRQKVVQLLQNDRRSLRQLRSEDQERIARLKQERAEARQALKKLRASTSWRVTAPLRRARGFARRS